MECGKEENAAACNCTYPCGRKGVCCECVSYHRARNELPACYFPPEVEKTYELNYRAVYKLWEGREDVLGEFRRFREGNQESGNGG